MLLELNIWFKHNHKLPVVGHMTYHMINNIHPINYKLNYSNIGSKAFEMSSKVTANRHFMSPEANVLYRTH